MRTRRSRRSSFILIAVVTLAFGAARSHATEGDAPPASLRVAVTPMAALVEFRDGEPVGVMADVWSDLAQRLGVTTTFVRIDAVGDVLEAVRKGTVDVALGPLAITEERERTIDMTHPVFHSGMRIAVRQQSKSSLVAALWSLLSRQLFSLLAVATLIALATGHLLWWVERRNNPHSFPPEYPRGVLEALWWIISVVITGGCDDKHVDAPAGRVIALGWMIGGIGLIAALTSLLTTAMTTEQVTGVIHSPRDLSGRMVGVQKEAVSAGSVRMRGGIVQEFLTIHDAIEGLDLGMVEAVVAEAEALMFAVTNRGKSGIRLVGPTFDSFDYGIAMPSSSPLREPLNAAILRMREEGALDAIKDRWLGKHE